MNSTMAAGKSMQGSAVFAGSDRSDIEMSPKPSSLTTGTLAPPGSSTFTSADAPSDEARAKGGAGGRFHRKNR